MEQNIPVDFNATSEREENEMKDLSKQAEQAKLSTEAEATTPKAKRRGAKDVMEFVMHLVFLLCGRGLCTVHQHLPDYFRPARNPENWPVGFSLWPNLGPHELPESPVWYPALYPHIYLWYCWCLDHRCSSGSADCYLSGQDCTA